MNRADLELFERSLRHATRSCTGAALDAALDDAGWHDALADSPRAAVSVLFELQGAAPAASAALGHVVGDALGLGPATGPAAGIVLPALGRWQPPGRLVDGGVRVRGLGLGLGDRAPTEGEGATALVVARAGDEDVAAVVPAAELAFRPVQGVDPWAGLSEVAGHAAPAGIEPVDWPAAVARAQLAVGHELVGAARAMLALARDHALERVQFGRPIAAFQAVRHRLADTLVGIEAADAALAAAWEDTSVQAAATAKALAGRGARAASRHCQQVLAGIGFTTEHPLHRYVRRVLVLDQLFGASPTLAADLGRELIRTRRLPAQLPL